MGPFDPSHCTGAGFIWQCAEVRWGQIFLVLVSDSKI